MTEKRARVSEMASTPFMSHNPWMTEHRFDDREIAEILARATRPTPEVEEKGGVRSDEYRGGLTLSELMEVASEAGIPPERIEAAAREIRPLPGSFEVRTLLGIPRGLSRTVLLAGAIDDDGWNRLVVLLRSTFGERGETSAEGLLRSWIGKEVEAHVEPDPLSDAWRLRIEATNTEDVEGIEAAGLLLVVAVVLGVLGLVLDRTGLLWLTGAMALLMVGIGGWCRYRLPRWTGERAEQIETVVGGVHRLAPGAAEDSMFSSDLPPSEDG